MPTCGCSLGCFGASKGYDVQSGPSQGERRGVSVLMIPQCRRVRCVALRPWYPAGDAACACSFTSKGCRRRVPALTFDRRISWRRALWRRYTCLRSVVHLVGDYGAEDEDSFAQPHMGDSPRIKEVGAGIGCDGYGTGQWVYLPLQSTGVGSGTEARANLGCCYRCSGLVDSDSLW